MRNHNYPAVKLLGWAAAAAVTLTSCGSGGGDDAAEAAPATADTEVTGADSTEPTAGTATTEKDQPDRTEVYDPYYSFELANLTFDLPENWLPIVGRDADAMEKLLRDDPEPYAELERKFDLDNLMSTSEDADFGVVTADDNFIIVKATDLSLSGEEENITSHLESVDGSTPKRTEYTGPLGTGTYLSGVSSTILILDSGEALFTIQAVVGTTGSMKNNIDTLLEFATLDA